MGHSSVIVASARLQEALEDRVSAGAPGALARVEAPGAGLDWTGSAGRTTRGEGRSLQPDDAFRIASVTKNITATVTVRLAQDGKLALDAPVGDQLDSELLERWRSLEQLPRTTPRQMLSHTSGLPNYFQEDFFARVRREPSRAWHPAELVDHAAAHGSLRSLPGKASATPTPASSSSESCWSRSPASRSTRCIETSFSILSEWQRRGSRGMSPQEFKTWRTITTASSTWPRSRRRSIGRRVAS